MATRAEIRSLAEVRSDTESSNFPTTDQKNLIIDDEAKAVYADMLAYGFPAKKLVVPITATGAASYPLVAPRLMRVAVRDARYGSVRPALRRANTLDKNINGNEWRGLSETKFDLEMDPLAGWQLSFYPASVTGSFEVEVLQGFPGFSSDGAEWYGPDPSSRVIALRSAIRFKHKEDEDAARPLMAELATAEGTLWQICQSLAPPLQMEDWVSLEESILCPDPYSVQLGVR